MLDPMQFLGLRKRAYQIAWKQPGMEEMIQDLIKFSHLRDPIGTVGTERSRDLIMGRQEVVWRILNHLHMSEADLYELYNRRVTSDGK